ncbi:hypothetical protein ACR3K2_21470 [Cryptosporidium serpentis]
MLEPIIVRQPDGDSKIGIPPELDLLLAYSISRNPIVEMWNISTVTIEQLKWIYFKHKVYFYIFFVLSLLFESIFIPPAVSVLASIFKYGMIENYFSILAGIIFNVTFTCILTTLSIINIFKRSPLTWRLFTGITVLWLLWQLISPIVQGRYYIIVISTRVVSAILAKFLSKALSKMLSL